MGIKSISDRDINSITSGQVIIDLTTAVKELVENSIDADSSQITVTFRNYGLETIEVQDNGLGIKEEDFESVCLKNYTSKLEKFEDVETVSTLGFRGEALSSLCTISEVNITTATKDIKPKAYKLQYSMMGTLENKSIISGKVGTTVTISNLFKNLPVRRMELTKSAKREFQKVLTFLQSYAIINLGVRIMVIHIDSKGKKSIMLSSSGAKTFKNNILSVFGPNGMYGLESIDIQIDLKTRFKLRSAGLIQVKGFVSNCSFGQGRSASDRQLWFINSRPVHLQSFSKAINEVYKSFNHLQFPVILLNMELDPIYVDVNVTPDKRTVLINNENLVIESLKEEMNQLFSLQDTRIPVNNLSISRTNDRHSMSNNKQMRLSDNFELMKPDDGDREIEEEAGSNSQVSDSLPKTSDLNPLSMLDCEQEEIIDSQKDHKNVVPYEVEFLEVRGTQERSKSDEVPHKMTSVHNGNDNEVEISSCLVEVKSQTATIDRDEIDKDLDDNIEVRPNAHRLYTQFGDDEIIRTETVLKNSRLSFKKYQSNICETSNNSEKSSPTDLKETSSSTNKRMYHQDVQSTHNLETILNVTPKEVQIKRPKFNSAGTHDHKLDDIKDLKEAERYLTLTVTKSDFLRMNIIGQFNLGFILVSKVDNDGKTNLFIVDQHASDEKYNFEKYQRETTFESQPLVIPASLDLNAIEELVIINNLQIFIKNGFKLKIDEDNYPGDRIKLTSIPYSKDTVFDMSDFNELTHLIKESDGSSGCASEMIRPSKVRAMFAMRACRSSIMIGKHLNYKTMERVIRNLSTLDKPWNCPHGRPTMRHLIEMKDWISFTDDYRV